jgi:6-phosphogluconolactonase
MSGTVITYPDPVTLARAAASQMEMAALDAIGRRGFFAVALSGGGSPHELFSALSGPPFIESFPWDRTFVFQVDERCVAPGDPASNYLVLSRMLLDRVPLRAGQFFRIRGELDPGDASADYEDRIARFFESRNRMRGGLPVFDRIVLGVGVDGHTASLFPKSQSLQESRRSVVPAEAPDRYAPTMRVSLTLPVINIAERVFFLVPGEEKRDIMTRFLDPGSRFSDLPAARVDPPGGCTFFTDLDL